MFVKSVELVDVRVMVDPSSLPLLQLIQHP
jgi:hypothetical protein